MVTKCYLMLLGSSRPYPRLILEENGGWNDDDELKVSLWRTLKCMHDKKEATMKQCFANVFWAVNEFVEFVD